jgi:hypothetical protein
MVEIGIIKMALYCAIASLFVGWLLARYRGDAIPARQSAR